MLRTLEYVEARRSPRPVVNHKRLAVLVHYLRNISLDFGKMFSEYQFRRLGSAPFGGRLEHFFKRPFYFHFVQVEFVFCRMPCNDNLADVIFRPDFHGSYNYRRIPLPILPIRFPIENKAVLYDIFDRHKSRGF